MKLGEILKQTPKNPGTRTKGGGKGAGGAISEPPATATLKDSGIDKKTSSRAQRLYPGTQTCQRPRCPGCWKACDKSNSKTYGGHDQGDGTRLCYVECLECGARFKVAWE